MSRPKIYANRSEKNKAYQHRKYERRKAIGQCVRCSNPSPGKINCADCTAKRRKSYVKERQQATEVFQLSTQT